MNVIDEWLEEGRDNSKRGGSVKKKIYDFYMF